MNSLVELSLEPVGDNCLEGGIRIDVGLDDDRDGVLDPEEIDDTAFICDVVCMDLDVDGYSGTGMGCGPLDCDDNDPLIYPDATEECNGIDDDCDEEVDKDFDGDSDGYAPCPPGELADCNDADPAVNPGATEVENGVDDDCNGLIDDIPGICTNAADIAIINDNAFQLIAGNCLTYCTFDVACTEECVINDTGLSADCAACYATALNCIVTSCFGDCTADPYSQACLDCQETECMPAFRECSGLPGGLFCAPLEESCNGEDDDCDTAVDEDFDMDLDGFAPCPELDPLDCDDTDVTINPDATDDTTDGIDQNCDGVDGPDSDNDGVRDADDNCPLTPNLDQLDEDTDTVGDACDNCPFTDNEDQANTYLMETEVGDACNACMLGMVTCPGDECNVGECVPTVPNGAGCWMNPRAAGTACDDGDACTTTDQCNDGGSCVGEPATCDDGNDCTDDACDAELGCLNVVNPINACDDGDNCTIGDFCLGDGSCVGTALDCNDANSCTADYCVDGACAYDVETDGTACDDGSVCTSNETCQSGVCGGGDLLDCDDANPCTDDFCAPAAGCFNEPAPGIGCDDGDACTEGDICDDAGACTGGAPTACDDGNPCTADSCDPAVGCAFVPEADSTPCDDGDTCTSGDTCQAGFCAGGAPLDCDDGNSCTDDSCDLTLGCVFTDNTAACDDGDLCTVGDTCNAGVCTGGAPTACDDGNPCTADSCDPAVGCAFVPEADSTPCDDGDACTSGDTCQAGACTSGMPYGCDDAIVCTTDACDGSGDCTYTPNHAVCDDANSCTDDICDLVLGCVSIDNTADCDDANPCTLDDTCNLGVCMPGTPISCDDGFSCTTDSCAPGSGCISVPDHQSCASGICFPVDPGADPSTGCIQ